MWWKPQPDSMNNRVMQTAPLISIVTITFNAEKELESTLRSVARQTFTDYEHLIVDGASNDATVEIAENFENPRLKVHSKPDSGIYHGMNRGLKYARGKYIIFLNAGDGFASANTLSLFAEKARLDYDIIYGDTVITDAAGNILRKRHLDAPEELTVKSFAKGMLVCHQAFMVKRSLAPEYNRKYSLSADYDWCIRCMKQTTPQHCANLHEVAIHYLDNGASEKHKLRSLRERFTIMAAHYGFFPTLLRHITFLFRALRRHL